MEKKDLKPAYQGDMTVERGERIKAELKKLGGDPFYILYFDTKQVFYVKEDSFIGVEMEAKDLPSGYTLKELPSDADEIKEKPKSILYKVSEIWDEYSEHIDNDITSLSRFADTSVITQPDFHKALTPILAENESLKAERERTDLLLKEMVQFGERRPESANYSYTDSAMCAAQLYQFISDAQTLLKEKI